MPSGTAKKFVGVFFAVLAIALTLILYRPLHSALASNAPDSSSEATTTTSSFEVHGNTIQINEASAQ
jgi:hypothetical protein